MSIPGSFSALTQAPLEAGAAALSTANLAIEAVIKAGFVFPPRPNQNYQGVLPTNLVQLSDEQLGDTMNQISNWLSYAQIELAKARSARNEAEAKMEFTKSRLRLSIKAATEKRTSNPEMDDLVVAEPRFLEAHRNYLYWETVYDYTRQLVEMSQRDWDTVSRRITQRGQDGDRGTRMNNVGNVPVMPGTFRSR
jgi:hypothetical protein